MLSVSFDQLRCSSCTLLVLAFWQVIVKWLCYLIIIIVVCTVCTALLFSYSAIFIAASVRNKLIHSSDVNKRIWVLWCRDVLKPKLTMCSYGFVVITVCVVATDRIVFVWVFWVFFLCTHDNSWTAALSSMTISMNMFLDNLIYADAVAMTVGAVGDWWIFKLSGC